MGPFELVVAWIHSYADTTLENISNVISIENNGEWKLFHVLGSKANLSEVQEKLKLHARSQYRQIQLGFMMDEGFYIFPLAVCFRCLHNCEGKLGLCEKRQNQPTFFSLHFT